MEVRSFALVLAALLSIFIGVLCGEQLTDTVPNFLWVFSASALVSFVSFYLCFAPLLPHKLEKIGDYGSAHWATKEEIEKT